MPVVRLPSYAADVPHKELVRLTCRTDRCRGAIRWARLQRDVTNIAAPLGSVHERFPAFAAICLRCGTRATDNYNWDAPFHSLREVRCEPAPRRPLRPDVQRVLERRARRLRAAQVLARRRRRVRATR